MLAAVDWHIVWERLVHPDHVFARALWTTVYVAALCDRSAETCTTSTGSQYSRQSRL
jgi:hypothetical protein